jgi:hypothetical protein
MRRCLISVSFLWPVMASAEVLDKEFSAPVLLGAALVFAVLGAWSACRSRVFVALLVAVLAVIFFGSHLSEILDPHVGPAMAAEGGPSYLAVSWGAPAVVVVGFLLGLTLRLRRGKPAP